MQLLYIHRSLSMYISCFRPAKRHPPRGAGGEAVSGNKAWLRRRLHTAVPVVWAYRLGRTYLGAAEADHAGFSAACVRLTLALLLTFIK